MALIIGIDDAGRGPLIGPMALAGVLLTEEQEKILKKAGVKDSKQLTHTKRKELAKIILENSINSKVVLAFPEEIDFHVNENKLNILEAKKAGEIINFLNNEKSEIKVVIDCPSVNRESWRKSLINFVQNQKNLKILCEHKADVNHVAVSAASILAKVAREEEVEKIKKLFAQHGDTGSGYPSDPATKEFLKKHGKTLQDSGIFRKTWSTWKKLFPEVGKKQASLGDF